MSKSNTVILKLTHAIVIAGQVVGTGRLVEVTHSEAKDLLRRGKAELHDQELDADADVTASGTTEPELHPEIAAHQEQAATKPAKQGKQK